MIGWLWHKRWLRWSAAIVLVVAMFMAVLLMLLDHYFNFFGNVTYVLFRESIAPLEIQMASGTWKTASSVTMAEMDHARLLQAESKWGRWSRVLMRRAPRNLAQAVANACLDTELNVIELYPSACRFVTSYRDGFVPTTAAERLLTDKLDFVITANFRDPDGKPLGLVVHEGREVNRHFPNWTGYFFVKNNRPWFGPKSLLEEVPGVVAEATQGYPSVMKNHTVFNYVAWEPNKYFDGNKITYRALAGVRRDGSVVFILSGKGAALNVSEVTMLAAKFKVQHATLLDGGRALQYALRLGGREYHFSAFNTELDLSEKGLAPQRSPVFIGVRASP